MDNSRMREREQGVPLYAPVALLVILIALVGLLATSPSRGGPLAALYAALREWIVGNEHLIADPAPPVTAASQETPTIPLPTGVPTVALGIPLPTDMLTAALGIPLPSGVPTVALGIPITPTSSPTSTLPCAAFHLAGTAQIEGGRISFGRFNLVTHTDPPGTQDPLASWKLVQFGSLSLDLDELDAAHIVTEGIQIVVPMSQTVNMLISDPFTSDMLFSAQWRVDELVLHGTIASINAGLQANLVDMRVNNSIRSETLAVFSKETVGVLVLWLEHTDDIAAAIADEQPVYTSMSGIVYPKRCLRQARLP